MDVKPGYKQTEVGTIPEDWKINTLEGVCLPGGLVRGPFGGSLKKEVFVRDGYKVYEQRNAIYRDADRGSYFIDEAKFKELSRFQVQEGDFIVSCSGTIGRIFQIPKSSREGVINQALLIIRTDSDVVNDRYFFYVFDWDEFQKKILDNTHGGAMQNLVGMDVFRGVSISLPPLLEQRAIAEALSDADALIESLEQLIAKKRTIKQGALQQLLTGKTRLPGLVTNSSYKQTEVGVIPDDWEVRPLGALCSMKSGEGITGADIDDYSPFPCYGGNGLRGYTKRFTHDGNYALIGRQGALCGNVLGARGRFFASEHAIVVTPFPNTDIHWLTFVLGDMNLNQYSESSAQPGLSVSKLADLPLAYPSTLAEQTAIAGVLSDMDAEIAALEQRRDKTKLLKQGMMQELLSGRIRLV